MFLFLCLPIKLQSPLMHHSSMKVQSNLSKFTTCVYISLTQSKAIKRVDIYHRVTGKTNKNTVVISTLKSKIMTNNDTSCRRRYDETSKESIATR